MSDKVIHAEDVAKKYGVNLETVMKLFGALVNKGLAKPVDKVIKESGEDE